MAPRAKEKVGGHLGAAGGGQSRTVRAADAQSRTVCPAVHTGQECSLRRSHYRGGPLFKSLQAVKGRWEFLWSPHSTAAHVGVTHSEPLQCLLGLLTQRHPLMTP